MPSKTLIKIIVIVSSLISFALILVSYESFAAVWGDQGYAFDPSFYKTIISIILIVFLTLSIDLRENLLLYVYIYLCLFVLLPSLAIFSFGNADHQYLLATLAPFLFISIFSRLSLPHALYFKILQINIQPGRVLIILIALLILNLPLLYFSTGGLFTLNIAEVYDLRETLTTEGLQGGIGGYLINNCRNVILPLSIFMLVRLRRSQFAFSWLVLLIVVSVFTLAFFAFTGSRATLIIPLYSLCLSYLCNSSFSYCIALSIMLIIFSSAGYLHAIFENSLPSFTILATLSEAFFKRTLLVPSNVNWQWTQYFDDPSKWTFFSDLPVLRSILGVSADASRRIAQDGFGWTWGSMNTGIIGSGFSDLGIVGSFISSFFAVMLLWIWSKQLTRQKVPASSAMCIAFYPVSILFTSSTLTSSLLGHGLLLSYLLTTSSSFRGLCTNSE
jgi:hypothetical protein